MKINTKEDRVVANELFIEENTIKPIGMYN